MSTMAGHGSADAGVPAGAAMGGARGRLRVALVQMTVTDGDPDANIARAAALIREAPAADLYLLPELFTTGYAHATWASVASAHTPVIVGMLQQLADERGAWIGGSMIAENGTGGLANRFYLFTPARQAFPRPGVVTYDKAHLFPPMGEPGRLVGGTTRVQARLGEPDAPIEAALSICFDLRFPEQYRLDAVAGATVFLCVAEWPDPRGETLRLLARARASENQAWLALCNRVGPASDGSTFAGRSCVIAPDGQVVADAGAGLDTVTVATIDTSTAHAARGSFAVLGLRVPGVDHEHVR